MRCRATVLDRRVTRRRLGMTDTSGSQTDGDLTERERFEIEQVNNLMLGELAHWGESFSQSEQSGEGRGKIFLEAGGGRRTARPGGLAHPAPNGKQPPVDAFPLPLF